MQTINQNFTYNNEGKEQPLNVDFILPNSNCYMYYVTNTQGAESAEEAKKLSKLFTAAPELLKVLKSYVDSMLDADYVNKWFDQYKNDPQANRVLVDAIAAIKNATS